MTKYKGNPAKSVTLRQCAVERQGKKVAEANLPPCTEADTKRLLHELQVHQIELKMQNEELLRAREEVEAGLEKYTDLYDFAPTGFFTFDGNGIVCQVNLTGTGLLGMNRPQLVHKRFGLFVTEQDRPVFNAFLQRVFAGKAREFCEVTLLKEDHNPLIVRIEAKASASGQQCHAVVLDITEHKRMEESLKKLHESLELRVKERTSELSLANKTLRAEIAKRRRIEELLWLKDAGINAAISGICFATPDGLILYVNEAFLKMWRFPSTDDVVGVHLSGLWEDRGAFERFFLQFTKEGHYVGELDARRQDGTVCTALISASLVRNDEQKTLCMMASFLDVTDRKQAAAELLRSKALRAEAEKLAAAGRLAAKIAHEINNPLAGIKNAFHLFKDAIPKDCPEHRFVEQTEKEIDRITRIVRQMYDLHRQNQERETDMRIEEEVVEVIAMLESKCRDQGVRIETSPPLPKVHAHAPEGALRQILFSLLGNAIEASPREGVVGVGMTVFDKVLVIGISDRGKGIPEAIRGQIFEPFFSTKTGKGTEGGLGLGLQTARQLTEALGGTLDFESEVDRGTVFRIHLPLEKIKGVLL